MNYLRTLLLVIAVVLIACHAQDDQQRTPEAGPALKSVHLLNLPLDVSESQMIVAFKEVNKVISELGYPGAGYRLWKTSGDTTTGYVYLWEGTWPSQTAYDIIHEDENYKNSWNPHRAMMEKLIQKYQRYAEVTPTRP